MIFACARVTVGSTLRAYVALCWNCDSAEGLASASIHDLVSACRRWDERAPGRLPER